MALFKKRNKRKQEIKEEMKGRWEQEGKKKGRESQRGREVETGEGRKEKAGSVDERKGTNFC